MQRPTPSFLQTTESGTIRMSPSVRMPAASIELAAIRNDNHSQQHTDDEPHTPSSSGFHAYLKVFGGFCVFFITLGVASTFGAYQAYYETGPLSSFTPSTISWIGTTQVFLLSFIGLFSGAFYDRGYVRSVLAAGMTLIVLGLMLLSVAQRYWQILITQGVCVGAGSGLIYVPAVSVVSNHFTKGRTVALGITATGSAVGGVILPIMFRKLLPSLGFGWTNRVFGFLVLLLAVIAFVLLTDVTWSNSHHHRHHSTEQRTRPSLETHASTDGVRSSPIASYFLALGGRAYLFLCIGVFFVFLGYWVPYFYIVPFATFSLGASSTSASYLLSILNAGSVFGRILPAYIGQKIGSAVVLFIGAAALSGIVFAWLGIQNVPGITVWCFLVGFSSGIVVSIPNAVASRLSSPSHVGLRIGFMWTVGAFAELIGAPIAGALVKHKHEFSDRKSVSYLGGQIFGGASLVVGAAFLVVPAWSIFRADKMKQERVD